MTDERKIVIVLKTEGGGTGESPISAPEDNKPIPAESANKSQSAAIAAYAALQLASTAVSEGLNWANYEIDKNLNLDDNYMAQRDKGIALQMISKVTGVFSTVAGSTAQGAMIGGAPGAIIGAAIGAISAASSIVRENLQAIEQQDIMLRQMDAQLSYTRQRAGWSTHAASIGEDL